MTTYYGEINVFHDKNKTSQATVEFNFDINESNHHLKCSGLAINTEQIDQALHDAMAIILNDIVRQQQEK